MNVTPKAIKPTIIRCAKNDERRLECEFCHKPFSRYGCLCKLQLENSVHKAVTCDICGKGLSETRNLINHRRSHTGEKPFECNICGKAFPSRDIVIHVLKINLSNVISVAKVLHRSQMLQLTSEFTLAWIF